MQESRYQLVYMQVRYNQKSKKLEVRKMDSYYMDTYAQAAAIAYAKHELSWKVLFRNQIIFTSNPAWSYDNTYAFAVIIKRAIPRAVKLFYNYGFSFDLTERRGHVKRNMIELIDFLCLSSRLFLDISLEASKWHKILSMPDGCRLLMPGEIVEETDFEYNSYQRTDGFFGKPSWYNIGKAIQEPQNIGFIKDGVTYRTYKALPYLVVARKISA